LADQSKFRLVVKSRQIGFSWTISGEALHKIVTTPNKTVNVVSINQKEASKKIVYAKQFYYTIPGESGFRVPVYTNAEYEFSVHDAPYTSYYESMPASAAIRGGEKDFYFDEFAFIAESPKLYDAALPATSRGNSRFTVVSTPLGQSGMFFDLAHDRMKYPDYSIHVVPWWECSIMSRDLVESVALAADFDTDQRVAKWGTPAIQGIFANMGLDAFQQEYECNFADESLSFYPWELIVSCARDDLNRQSYVPGLPYNIGIDIAKKVDKTVITVSTIDEETGNIEIHKTFETQAKYEDQTKEIISLIDSVKPQRVSIDATGVGAVIAEQLTSKYGGMVEPIVFDRVKKEQWATKFKGDMQSGRIAFPRKRELLSQIHTIERRKSEVGNYVSRQRR